MDDNTAIRCPNERPHSQYHLCGRLLGAVIDNELCLYCEDCKTFFKVRIIDNHNIEMKPFPKNIRLRLKTALRVILNDW